MIVLGLIGGGELLFMTRFGKLRLVDDGVLQEEWTNKTQQNETWVNKTSQNETWTNK